jgi:hypothetical protein
MRASLSKPVQIGSQVVWISIAPDGIPPLLVSKKNYNIWFFHNRNPLIEYGVIVSWVLW